MYVRPDVIGLSEFDSLYVSDNADITTLIRPKSRMSVERVDADKNEAICPLGMISVSADRRGSISPTNLPHTKHETIKSSATEPHLSSAYSEQDRNVRYVVLVFYVCDENLLQLSCVLVFFLEK